MPGIGERLWEMGKLVLENMGLVFFGLVTLLGGVLAISLIGVAGAGSAAALILAANALLGIGGVFPTPPPFPPGVAALGGGGSPPLFLFPSRKPACGDARGRRRRIDTIFYVERNAVLPRALRRGVRSPRPGVVARDRGPRDPAGLLDSSMFRPNFYRL